MPHKKINCKNHPEIRQEALGLCKSCYRKHLKLNGPSKDRLKFSEFRKTVSSSKNFWYHLKSRYNLSENDYINMYNSQNGVCASCNASSKLIVDHNHSTNKVRALLCSRCNTIAGAIEDTRYNQVLKYLRRYDE